MIDISDKAKADLNILQNGLGLALASCTGVIPKLAPLFATRLQNNEFLHDCYIA